MTENTRSIRTVYDEIVEVVTARQDENKMSALMQEFLVKTGLKVSAFGKRIGMNPYAISRWINKTSWPTIQSLKKLEVFLDENNVPESDEKKAALLIQMELVKSLLGQPNASPELYQSATSQETLRAIITLTKLAEQAGCKVKIEMS